MIINTAKDIIIKFQINKFIETGMHQGDTLDCVYNWFLDIYRGSYPDDNSKYKIYDVDLNPDWVKKAEIKYHSGNENKNVVLSCNSSEKFLRQLIDKNEFTNEDRCIFFLDAHWNSYWPLKDEIREILKLRNKPVIIIDDFKTPNKNFGYDTYDHALDTDYIKSLINDRTDVMYYSSIPATPGNQGVGFVFIDRYQEELQQLLKDMQLFFEKL